VISRLIGGNRARNDSFEYFEPFGKVMVTNAQFAPSSVLQKVAKMYKQVILQVIIITSFNGHIKVLYQLK